MYLNTAVDGMSLAARSTPDNTMVVHSVQNSWAAPEGSTPGLLEGIFIVALSGRGSLACLLVWVYSSIWVISGN